MKIYMIGGTDSHVKCGVKDYTLELQRYLEQENVDIVQINDKSDTATISDWQSIFAYHKLAVELKKINARILHVEYPAKAYGKSIGVNFLPMFARLRGIKVVFTTHEYSNRSFLGRMRQIPSFLFANEIIVVDPQFEVDIKKIPLCKKKVRTIRIGSNIVPSVAPNDKIIELHNSLVKDNMKLMSYFGFINEYKCFLELVEAIKHLKDAGKLKSKLVVIGELKESDEYHKKVLEKIRDIRSSEKVFWRKILDIYATSVDYDAKNEQTREFFRTVQNKMHYAVHGNTAAEVIFNRVDSEKENIGLTNFKGSMPTRAETEIAKNYLNEKELNLLNRMVSAYLDVAEINALNMHAMTMKEWVNELNGFLTMTHKDILEGAGTISHEKALAKAHEEYDKYMRNHLTQAEKDYLEIMSEDIKKLK